MPEDNQRIINEYRDADFEKRLYFYLSYRNLRDKFIEIDQSDTPVGFSENPVKTDFRLCGTWCQNLINAFK